MPTSKIEVFTKIVNCWETMYKGSHPTCDRVPEFIFDKQITLDIFTLRSIFYRILLGNEKSFLLFNLYTENIFHLLELIVAQLGSCKPL